MRLKYIIHWWLYGGYYLHFIEHFILRCLFHCYGGAERHFYSLQYSRVVVEETLGLHCNHLLLLSLHIIFKNILKRLLVVGWILAIQPYLVLIPGTCKCNFKGKNVFAYVIKLRILTVADFPGLSSSALYPVTASLEIQFHRKGEGNVTRKADWRDATTGQQRWQIPEPERQGSDLPLSLQREHRPVSTLRLAQWKWL